MTVVIRRRPKLPHHCRGCRCFDALSDLDAAGLGAYHGPASRAPDTEKAAAYAVEPALGTKRRAVLQAFIDVGRAGLTDYELRHYMKQHTGGPQARRHELKLGGWVVDSGRRRVTGHGGGAAVWVLSSAAHERLGL